ncbi:recombinase family protein [Streptomyces sp. JV185]|nr:recombinase family protein [Streptomyces sp. JV185]
MPDRQADLAYARVSTTAQDLDRQIDAFHEAGIAEEHIYVDKRTGASMDREGLTELLGFARPGDRINVLTPDRLGHPAHPLRSRDPQCHDRPHDPPPHQ